MADLQSRSAFFRGCLDPIVVRSTEPLTKLCNLFNSLMLWLPLLRACRRPDSICRRPLARGADFTDNFPGQIRDTMPQSAIPIDFASFLALAGCRLGPIGRQAVPDCQCPPFDCAANRSRCLAANRAACGELIRAVMPHIEAIVRGRLANGRSDDWEDVRQGVALRILERLGQWNRIDKFCHWVAAIASRLAISAQRAKRPLQWHDGHEEQAEDAYANAKVTRECIDAKLARFPVEWRRIYERTIQGLSREETARAEDISVRTLHYRLEMIREELRPCLER